MEQFFKDWWGAIVSGVGLLFAWRLGTAQNSWRLNQLHDDHGELKGRVKSLESARLTDVKTLAEMSTQLNQQGIVLIEIRDELKRKADK